MDRIIMIAREAYCNNLNHALQLQVCHPDPTNHILHHMSAEALPSRILVVIATLSTNLN